MLLHYLELLLFFLSIRSKLLFSFSPDLAGIFLGTAIHDTAQVSAASVIYSDMYNSEEALNSAITTKLLRNSFLILLIPLIAYFIKKKKVDVKIQLKIFSNFCFRIYIIISFANNRRSFILDNDIMTIGNIH